MKDKIGVKLSKLLKRNSSFLSLVLLIIITTIVTAYKLKIQLEIGPMWDSFSFLINAQFFAGQGVNIDLIRPVFLSFLTSLLFRMGYISTVTISIVDSAFFVSGVIGLYLFLKLRFNNIQSLLGAVIFVSFPVILLWVGVGYTDIASTSLSIWALYLTVMAVKKNPKFFYLTFPLLILAFLTRFSAAITIFPILFYMLINRSHVKNLKEISIGIGLSLLILAPTLIFWYDMLGNPFLPFLGTYCSSSGPSSADSFSYNSDHFFYVKNALYCFFNLNFLNNSSVPALAAFLICEITIIYSIMMGLVIYLHKILRTKKNEFKPLKNLLNLEKTQKMQLIMILTIFLVLIFSITKINYLLSDLLLFGLVYILYRSLNQDTTLSLDIDLLVFLWLMCYMIFNSFYQIKVCRYFIPMAPAVTYFMTLGITEFFSKMDSKIKKTPLSSILTVAMIAVFLVFTCSYLHHLEYDAAANGSNFHLGHGKFEIMSENYTGELYFETYNTNELKMISNWLRSYDPNYKNKVIYTDYFWPQLSWYLKIDVKGITTPDTGEYLNTELKNQKADYYINMVQTVNLKDYVKIKDFKTKFGNVAVYKRVNN